MSGDGNPFLYIQPPQELKFTFELKKQVSCSLHLTNATNESVAFKVKTTSPKKYCVRPNTGVIPPNSNAEVTVMMQAQKEAPADMQCKDKFLVQSVLVPSGYNSTSKDHAELFGEDGQREIQSAKLRVVYVQPPPPPSPVPEDEVAPGEPEATTGYAEVTAPPPAKSLGSTPKDFAPVSEPSSALLRKRSRGWTLFHVFVIAIIAFLFGYFYGQAPTPALESPAASSTS
eukprot:TRINITY_DN121_c0_g2_i2.p1 TRINITY_DN121_c0_g2~~TRINITY_DN121_c0_g2_i2.p1  ORF type:complete len:229 (-),score=42.73 TRINITY_DN121_c0_g2_i2:713-1399(-)